MKNAFFTVLFALAIFTIYMIQAKYSLVMAAMGNKDWTIVIGLLMSTIAVLSVMLYQTAQRLRKYSNHPVSRVRI